MSLKLTLNIGSYIESKEPREISVRDGFLHELLWRWGGIGGAERSGLVNSFTAPHSDLFESTALVLTRTERSAYFERLERERERERFVS